MQGLPVHVTESPYELTQTEHSGLLDNLVPCIPASKDRPNGAVPQPLFPVAIYCASKSAPYPWGESTFENLGGTF